MVVEHEEKATYIEQVVHLLQDHPLLVAEHKLTQALSYAIRELDD